VLECSGPVPSATGRSRLQRLTGPGRLSSFCGGPGNGSGLDPATIHCSKGDHGARVVHTKWASSGRGPSRLLATVGIEGRGPSPQMSLPLPGGRHCRPSRFGLRVGATHEGPRRSGHCLTVRRGAAKPKEPSRLGTLSGNGTRRPTIRDRRDDNPFTLDAVWHRSAEWDRGGTGRASLVNGASAEVPPVARGGVWSRNQILTRGGRGCSLKKRASRGDNVAFWTDICEGGRD